MFAGAKSGDADENRRNQRCGEKPVLFIAQFRMIIGIHLCSEKRCSGSPGGVAAKKGIAGSSAQFHTHIKTGIVNEGPNAVMRHGAGPQI